MVSRRCLWLGLLFTCLLGTAAPATGLKAAEKTRIEDESPSATLPEDSKTKSYLRRAETAVKEKDWNQALTLLDRIVRESGDALVLFNRNTLEQLNIDADTVQFHWWTFISTRELVSRMMADMPKEAQDLRTVTAEPQAQNLLDSGIESGDAEILLTLVENYPQTKSADNALYTLGEWNLLKEDYPTAASCYRRILAQYPDSDLNPAAIRWRLVQVLDLAGDPKGAAAELNTLIKANTFPVTAGAQALAAEAPAWLTRLQQAAQAGGIPGAVASSAATMMGSETHTNFVQDVPAMGNRMLKMEYDRVFIDNQYDSKIHDRDAAANIIPVVRDETIFLTDGLRIRAFNLINADPKRPYWAQPSTEDNRPLQANKFEHARTLTVSDNMVFAVLGASKDITPTFDWQRGNQFQLENTYINGYERPQGNPVMFGRIKWSTDKRDDLVNSEADKQFLSQLHIPAAPVYVDGMLYCYGVSTQDEHPVYALAINADTGRLRWRRQLCSGSLLSGTNRTIDLGSQVAVAAGRVYILTPMGTLACIDAISGSVKWETTWQQTLEVQKLNAWNQQSHFPDDVPYPQPPIVFKDRVLIMPQDCNWLMGFDTETGAPKWICDRRDYKADLHYLMGIATTETTVRRKGVKSVEQIGMLIAAGRKAIAFNVSNGKAIWECDLSEYEKAVGIGVVTENYVLIPTSTHLVPINVHDGKIPGDSDKAATWHRYKWEDPKLERGHILVNRGVIITAGANGFNVYYSKADREKQLLETMQASGETPGLWMQVADLDDRVNDFEKALVRLAKARELAETWAALPATDPKSEIGKQALQETLRRIGVINFQAGKVSLVPLLTDEDKPADAADRLTAEAKTKLAAAALPHFDTGLNALRLLTTADREDMAHSLWGRARALEFLAADNKQGGPAIETYQELLADYGDVRFTYLNDGKTEGEAYGFATDKIAALIATYGRDQYQPVEARALAIFNEEIAKPEEQRNLERLRKLLHDFPNATATGDVQLLLCDLTLKKEGTLPALSYLHSFLALHSDDPRAPQIMVRLINLYRDLKYTSAAKCHVLELKRRFLDRKIQADGQEMQVAAYVEKMLALPEMQPVPSIAQRKTLTITPVEAWPLTLPRQNQIFGLEAEGEPPAGCEKFIYVHDGRDIYCIEGATGTRRFAHHVGTLSRPSQVAFAGNSLVSISAESTVSGENAGGSGDQTWDYEFTVKGEKYQAQFLTGCDTLALVVDRRNLAMAGIEPTSGRELWTRNNIKGQLGLYPPSFVDGRLIIVTFDDGTATCNVLDPQSGQSLCDPYKLEAKGVKNATVSGTTLVVQDRENALVGYELFTGKELWKTATPGPALTIANQWMPVSRPTFFATEKAVVMLRDSAIHILNLADGKSLLPGNEKFIDVKGRIFSGIADGDQLFVALTEQNGNKQFIEAFSLTTGELLWKTPSAAQLVLSPQHITRGHLLTGTADFQNGNTFTLNLVDRTTGKIVYSNKLHNTFPRAIASCDGAFLFADQMKARGFVCVDPAEIKKKLVTAEKAFQDNPKDIGKRMDYIDLLALGNQPEKAFDLVLQAFEQNLVDDANWQTFATKLEALRRNALETRKFRFLVQKTATAPKIDGKLDDWKDAVWNDFASLQYIYHDTFDKNMAKSFWKKPDDLSCKTAMKWDKDNLYICWVVTDDTHIQTKTGQSIWDGDSVQFAFDPTLDGGNSWRQGDTEDTLAVDSANGNSMSCIDYSPTNKTPEFKGVHDEAKHQTIYEMSMPLADLGLDGKDGGKFGYTFIVNDRDDEKSNLNKGLAPSPGIWNPKTPDLYARGYFGKEGQKELDADQKGDKVEPNGAEEVDPEMAID